MARLVLAAAAVLALAELSPARAQFFVPGYSYGSSYSYRSGIGFGFVGSHLRIGGFAGGFATRSAFVSPYGYGFGFGGINPYGGWGPGFGTYGFGFAPTVIAVPVPVPVVVGGNFPDPDGNGLGGKTPPRDDGALLPRGDYLGLRRKRPLFPRSRMPNRFRSRCRYRCRNPRSNRSRPPHPRPSIRSSCRPR